MARTSIDRASVEFLKVPVTAPPEVALGSQVVEVAILADPERPVEESWTSAEWAGTAAIRVLVGPGAIELEPGAYKVWVRITDTPEIPVLIAGTITVT